VSLKDIPEIKLRSISVAIPGREHPHPAASHLYPQGIASITWQMRAMADWFAGVDLESWDVPAAQFANRATATVFLEINRDIEEVFSN